MSTGNQNLDLLIKLLNLTTSSQDGEALVAIRKANEQLSRFNATWESLIRSKVTIVADPFSGTPSQAQPTFQSRPAPAATPPRPAPPPPPPRPAPRPASPSSRSLKIDFNALINDSVRNGRLVEAIRLYRKWKNCDSSTAKKAVDNIAIHLGVRQPDSPQQSSPQQSSPQRLGPNKFEGRCYVCQRKVAIGEGFLVSKNALGKWRTECGDQKGHNLKGAARPPRPSADLDDLLDINF